MNCHDFDHAIYVYLDGEFAPPEEADVENHLGACSRCRGILARELAFLDGVRRLSPAVVAPADLRERVLGALGEAPLPRAEEPAHRPRSRAPWLAGGLALAAALVALILWRVSAEDDARQVVSEALAAHQVNLPMDVRGSEREIHAFLDAHVPFSVEIPFVDRVNAKLTGARLTRVHGREAVLFNFELDGERLTVVQVASRPDLPADTPPSVRTLEGFDVVTYRRRGVMSSVIGSGASPAVRRLVHAAYQP